MSAETGPRSQNGYNNGRRKWAGYSFFVATVCLSPPWRQQIPPAAEAFSSNQATPVEVGRYRGRHLKFLPPVPKRTDFGVSCYAVDTDTSEALKPSTATQLPKLSEFGGFKRALENFPSERHRPPVIIRPDAQDVRLSSELIVASVGEDEQNNEDVTCEAGGGEETTESHSEDEEPSPDEVARAKRSAAAAAALLRRNAGGRRSVSGTRSGRTNTSVGAIRKGAASRAGRSLTGSILGTVRTAARAAAAAGEKKAKEDSSESVRDNTTNVTSTDVQDGSVTGGTEQRSSGAGSMGIASKTVIQSTINDLLSQQDETNKGGDGTVSASLSGRQTSMGLFGEPSHGPQMPPGIQFRNPCPGSILVHPKYIVSEEDHDVDRIKDHITVRVATPSDDCDIAMLRLSVFSDFTPDLRRKFCQRSCEVLSHRRSHGATCLVASVDRSRRGDILTRNGILGAENYVEEDPALGEQEWIIGSVECSVHEFHGTALGNRRPSGSILYVTEVAVWPHARRCGAGALLMQGVAELAAIRQVETIYLHVDVTNDVACSMYEKAGFEYADKTYPIFEEFTTSLNLHDGATKGRNHHLLFKHLTDVPTWIEPAEVSSESSGGNVGASLGFEVPLDA